MLLYLMRHGIAQDRYDPDAPSDPERPLTARGIERTESAVAGLLALDVEPDVVLTSPYVRARETAEIAARVLRCDRASIIETEALLPICDPSRLFLDLRRIDPSQALCVGHAPSIDELCAFALGGGTAPLTELKKAGVAAIQIDAPAPAPAGRLLWLLEPGMLRELGRVAQDKRPRRRKRGKRP